jgi:hypothetical protein
MVTPTSLNGNGCAPALAMASVDAKHRPAIKVFMNASLLSRHSVGRRQRESYHLDGTPESVSALNADRSRCYWRCCFAILLPSGRLPIDADGALTDLRSGATLREDSLWAVLFGRASHKI